MTPVASPRYLMWAERLALFVAASGLATLVGMTVLADRDAPRHSVWRDPISWFGADEAPNPGPTRVVLVLIGVALVVFALSGLRRRRPWLALLAIGSAGALVIVVGAVPIECSLRIDYCEKLVQARLVGGGHLWHAAASAALLVLCVATVVVDAVRGGRRWRLALGVAVLAAAAVLLADPTNDRAGPLQWVVLVGSAPAAIALWRGDAVRRSSEAPRTARS